MYNNNLIYTILPVLKLKILQRFDKKTHRYFL